MSMNSRMVLKGVILNGVPPQVRKQIELEILKKCYLHDVLKRECWDSMKVKGKAIKVKWSHLEVPIMI